MPKKNNSVLTTQNSQMPKDNGLTRNAKPSEDISPFSDLIERLISDNDSNSHEVKNGEEPDGKDSDFLNEIVGEKEEELDKTTVITPDANNDCKEIQDTELKTTLNQPVSSNISSNVNEIQQIYTTPDSSTDDFYSKFKRGNSIVSPGWSPEEEPSIEEAIEKSEPLEVVRGTTKKDLQNRLADTWTEFLAPGTVASFVKMTFPIKKGKFLK